MIVEQAKPAPTCEAALAQSYLPTSLRSSGSKDGVLIARWLVANRWDAILKRLKVLRGQPNPNTIAAAPRELSRPILGLLQASVVAADPKTRGAILDTAMARNTQYPLDGLVHLLRAATENRPPHEARTIGLSTLHTHSVEVLRNLLRQPVRAADDWSIAVSCRCTCRLCGTLAEFLRDPRRRQFDWPLARTQRAHIHHAIDAHDLPVTHITRRVGRPFTLVLGARWNRDLIWLASVTSA